MKMLLQANIKIKPLFTCASCGQEEFGQQKSVSTPILLDSDTLKRFVDSVEVKPADMPYYWRSDYGPKGNIYTCPICNGHDIEAEP